MRAKIRNMIFVGLAVLVMIAVPVLEVLLPHDGTLFYEMRRAAGVPELTAEGVWEGSYFSGLDDAVSDRFPGRSIVGKTSTKIDLLMNKPVANKMVTNSDVLLDYFGYIFWDISYLESQAKTIAEGYATLRDKIESYGGYFCYLGIPQQNSYYADQYPDYMDSRLWHTTGIRNYFTAAVEEQKVPYIGMYEVYKELGFPKEYYFETDHHYTFRGAYVAYQTLIERINRDTGLNIPMVEENELDWTTLEKPFLGSSNRKLYGLWDTMDVVEIAEPLESIPFERWDNGTEVPATVYTIPGSSNWSTYSVYMGGDIAETIIRTNRPELKKILVIGDSFTNPLESLLWMSFDEMRSLDFRYYTAKTLTAYLEEYQPDVVICVRDESVYLATSGNGTVE